MASLESLEEVMQEELKDIYDAEKQITKALPKLMKKATASELKQALEQHLRQTEQQIDRLEQIFEQFGMPARGKKCTGMKNLLAEGDEMIGDADEDATRDAVMIAAAQKVEHYEIAAYGTLRTWANLLGKDDVAALLEDTLEEEKEADQKLTSVAESIVNEAAVGEGDQDEEEEATSRGRAAQARRSIGRTTRPMAADRGRAAARGRRAKGSR
jgi:ferritin-like metal-binding protein YciE